MKKFNAFFKSKITKFIIILVVIGLFALSFYKRNKEEVKDVVFMYTTGDSTSKTEESVNDKVEEPTNFRDKISKIMERKEKPKKWVDTRTEEYKKIIERIKQQDKDRILEKYSFTQEDIEKGANIVTNRANDIIKFQNLLKNEYNNKKRTGKLRYGARVKNNDYIYVSVNSIIDNKEIQKGISKDPTFFVLRVNSNAEKTFNNKLLGKRINNVVYLKIEDFLSKEDVKLLHEIRADAQGAVEDIIEMYPYLDVPEYRDFIKYTDFSMKFTILDILDEDFINRNNIKNKVFDYNK